MEVRKEGRIEGRPKEDVDVEEDEDGNEEEGAKSEGAEARESLMAAAKSSSSILPDFGAAFCCTHNSIGIHAPPMTRLTNAERRRARRV